MAYRDAIEEQGKVPCDYLGCHRAASQVWERSELELRQMSAKRQYRALLREQITGKPHKPRKVSGKGHRALATFHACGCHVPAWRSDSFVPFANLPQVSWEESIPAHWHEPAAA